MLYFDWNATTPPLPEAIDAMRDAALRTWGNPSSIHGTGRAARACVEAAREAVAELAGADPRDALLTSGGTEANNIALRSAIALAEPGTIVTSRIEHPSVTRVVEALEREGRARVRWVAAARDGRLDDDDLAAAMAIPDVRLVTVQAVNHETGVLPQVAHVLAAARAHPARPRVHVDAVQAFGKLASDVLAPALGADTIALAGHKFRGPKGIGALVTRPGVRIVPVLLGGAQERGLRPGTLDPVSAAGLAIAARHARSSPLRYAALASLRDALESGLVDLGGARVGTADRAPHVANVSFSGWAGAELVAALDLEGLCASSGSACSAGTIEPSPVVTAMLGADVAATCVRFSLGETTTRAEVDEALAIAQRILRR